MPLLQAGLVGKERHTGAISLEGRVLHLKHPMITSDSQKFTRRIWKHPPPPVCEDPLLFGLEEPPPSLGRESLANQRQVAVETHP